MASASSRVARSRSSRRFSRRFSARRASRSGCIAHDLGRCERVDGELTLFVAAMHAQGMLDPDGFAEMVGRAFDEAMRQRAKFARRIVTQQQRAVRAVLEMKMRTARAGIKLAHFRMDDAVDAEHEAARGAMGRKESGIVARQQR